MSNTTTLNVAILHFFTRTILEHSIIFGTFNVPNKQKFMFV
uniref:Uncharacterized protein n=1 Tax=Podoviridae sp. ctyhm34 TaxID=2826595 RepID=A0A8S5N0L9_9CAUD|nr:MAG TPA: hypothetical protein [Podoviridae sp. ctyhm34]DAE86623.1 MAG TPA: hypothetical protein [Caudoviricetes sp.]